MAHSFGLRLCGDGKIRLSVLSLAYRGPRIGDFIAEMFTADKHLELANMSDEVALLIQQRPGREGAKVSRSRGLEDGEAKQQSKSRGGSKKRARRAERKWASKLSRPLKSPSVKPWMRNEERNIYKIRNRQGQQTIQNYDGKGEDRAHTTKTGELGLGPKHSSLPQLHVQDIKQETKYRPPYLEANSRLSSRSSPLLSEKTTIVPPRSGRSNHCTSQLVSSLASNNFVLRSKAYEKRNGEERDSDAPYNISCGISMPLLRLRVGDERNDCNYYDKLSSSTLMVGLRSCTVTKKSSGKEKSSSGEKNSSSRGKQEGTDDIQFPLTPTRRPLGPAASVLRPHRATMIHKIARQTHQRPSKIRQHLLDTQSYLSLPDRKIFHSTRSNCNSNERIAMSSVAPPSPSFSSRRLNLHNRLVNSYAERREVCNIGYKGNGRASIEDSVSTSQRSRSRISITNFAPSGIVSPRKPADSLLLFSPRGNAKKLASPVPDPFSITLRSGKASGMPLRILGKAADAQSLPPVKTGAQ